MLIKDIGQTTMEHPQDSELLKKPVVSGVSESLNSSLLQTCRVLDEIGEKAYQGQITPDQMFDKVLDEIEFRFTDDFVDRKRFLAALKRKCDRLEAGISREYAEIGR